MAKPKIAFVDDDRFFSSLWTETLREDFEVMHCQDAETACKYIEETSALRCVVLDLMMPSPSSASVSETADGMETGLWLLRNVGRFIKSREVPVVILTNRDSPDLASRVANFDFPKDLVSLRRKFETTRRQLTQIVRDKVTRWSKGPAAGTGPSATVP